MADTAVAAATTGFFTGFWNDVLKPGITAVAQAKIQDYANKVQSQAQHEAATSKVTSKSNVPTYLIAGGVAVAALAVGLKLFGGRGRGGRR
jgi:hypothetical protein